jgi:anti-anti-sigma factor
VRRMTARLAPDEVPDALVVDVHIDGPRTHVAVRGELDVATAPALERAVADHVGRGGLVVLDLRELSFIDASGPTLLLRTDAHARRDGMELQLIPSGSVRRLLTLCGLETRFSCADAPPD